MMTLPNEIEMDVEHEFGVGDRINLKDGDESVGTYEVVAISPLEGKDDGKYRLNLRRVEE